MRYRRVLPACALIAAAVALAPAPALATHNPDIGGVHYRPQVAVAPTTGTATVVWEGVGAEYRRVVFVRRRTAAGALGVKRQVSSDGVDSYDARVAVDGSGAATIVWRKSIGGASGVIQMRRVAPDGTLGAIIDLAPAGTPSEPDVAVSPEGLVTVVWQQYDTALGYNVVRARQRAGVFPLREIKTIGRYEDGAPQVAVDASGNATVAWIGAEWSSGWWDVVKTRRLSSAGALGTEAVLSPLTAFASHVQLAAAPSGRATVAWVRSDGTHLRVESRWRDPAGTLGPPALLSAAGQSAFLPQLAGDQDGDVTFTWQRSNGTHQLAQTRTRAGGVLSAVQTLSAIGQNVSKPQIAVAPAGDARFVWHRFNGTEDIVQTRRRTAAGVLGPVVPLSAVGSSSIEQQVAVDANGNAVIVWTRQGELHDPANLPHLQLRAISAAGAISAVQNLE